MTDHDHDIAVTGMAAISPAGAGTAALRQALAAGECLLSPVPEELLGEAGHRWGRLEWFKAGDFIPPLKARKFDRCSQFAVIATGMALADAGISPRESDPARVGIVLGCGFGGIANSTEFLSGYLSQGVEGLVPMLFPNTVPNAPASNASIEHGIKGPNVTFVQRFTSAESALLMACRYIREGRADVMVAGGVDELTPTMMQGFRDMGQLHRHARGFGEGAGILVLERASRARERGATIRGTIGTVRTVGRLLPGREADGMSRLLGGARTYDLVTLSGSAATLPGLPGAGTCLEPEKITGRSLAMGGIALVSHLLLLTENSTGLHLGSSPEGPHYAVKIHGGAPG
jgi:3-oxoacyl-[acyl-carrier-protein] synthase II